MATRIHGAGPSGERSPGLNAAIAGYLADNPSAGGGGASALDDLTDVDTTGQTTGDVLKYNGTNWVADAASAGVVTSTDISDSTAVGRDVLTAADAATARAAIGAGTAAAADTGDFATAEHNHDSRYYTETETDSLLSDKAATSHTHAAADVTSGTLAVARLGSGTPAAGTYVDGGTGAWTALPAGGGGGTSVPVAKFRTSGGTTYPQFLPGHYGTSRDLSEVVGSTTIYLPFTALGDWSPTEFVINVLTAGTAGTVLYAWLYAADADYQPTGSPVLDITAAGGFPVDSTGEKAITGFSTTIPAGNYVALIRGSGNATLRAYGIAQMAPATNLGPQFMNRPERNGVTDTTAPATGPKWTAAPSSNNGLLTCLFWR